MTPPSAAARRLGLVAVLISQFLSTFADNAIIFLAIALLKSRGSPGVHVPYLQESFVAAFIVLAPFVGPFADTWPKGRVLMLGTMLKLVGAFALFAGFDAFLSYGAIGVGAAIVSPAKSGILGELTDPRALVKANSFLEASTVVAVLAGAVLGARYADLHAHGTVLVLMLVYVAATLITLAIPRLAPSHPQALSPWGLFISFWPKVVILVRDPASRLSLLGTAMFWGAAAVLRFLLIAWLPVALGIKDLATAGYLTAATALGVALGAVLAGQVVRLERVDAVVPAGLLMGVFVAAFTWITSLPLALTAMILIGALGGFFIVPLNALLQQRGRALIGSGGAIAVQNLVDNGGMLILVAGYLSATESGLSPYAGAAAMGAFLIGMTLLLLRESRHMPRQLGRAHD